MLSCEVYKCIYFVLLSLAIILEYIFFFVTDPEKKKHEEEQMKWKWLF